MLEYHEMFFILWLIFRKAFVLKGNIRNEMQFAFIIRINHTTLIIHRFHLLQKWFKELMASYLSWSKCLPRKKLNLICLLFLYGIVSRNSYFILFNISFRNFFITFLILPMNSFWEKDEQYISIVAFLRFDVWVKISSEIVFEDWSKHKSSVCKCF